jgi:hypothetical protein
MVHTILALTEAVLKSEGWVHPITTLLAQVLNLRALRSGANKFRFAIDCVEVGNNRARGQEMRWHNNEVDRGY